MERNDFTIEYNNEVCNLSDYQMPDFWMFKLMNNIFFNEYAYLHTNIKGVCEAIDSLESDQKDVLMLRYKDGLTLAAIGERLNIHPERVRQLEAKAMRRLRHPSRENKILSIARSELKELEKENRRLRSELEKALKNNSVYDMHVDELDLSSRSRICLIRGGFETVGEIVDSTVEDLMKIRNLGHKSLEEILDKLKDLGLSLKD